jgi:hypothetical protein
MDDTNYDGSFQNSLRFNSLTGRIGFTVFEPATGGFVLQEITLGTDEARFAMGISWREHGWALIEPGTFDVVTTPVGTKMPEKPSPDHKRCRVVPMYSELTGELRWTVASFNMVMTLDHLWNSFRRSAEAAAGKQPIVFFAGLHEVPNQRVAESNLFLLDIVVPDWVEPWAIPGWGERPVTVPPPVILPMLLASSRDRQRLTGPEPSKSAPDAEEPVRKADPMPKRESPPEGEDSE